MSALRQSLGISANVVVVDYYDGAYGPTLRIDVQDRGRLEELERLIAQLASMEAASAKLEDLRAVLVRPPLRSVELVLAKVDVIDLLEPKPPLRKALRKVSHHDFVDFVWSQTALEWKRIRGLVSGLGNGPGHQYLTKEGHDDALIELAFME